MRLRLIYPQTGGPWGHLVIVIWRLIRAVYVLLRLKAGQHSG
jgi:hypothetical protein